MSVSGLLGPSDIRALADRLGVRPTKQLGQNFVHDPNTVRRIVATAGVTEGQHVLEVGPGLGSLTLGLLAVGTHVVAVEIDPVLAAALPDTVAERLPDAAQRLRVLTADAITVPAEELGTGAEAPTALVANLPYNVAVPVLLGMLERLPSIATALVMVQAEVADRLCALPGSRIYGVPSVKAGWYAHRRAAGGVPRPVFWPVPNVDSSLVRLTRRDSPLGDDVLRRRTFAAVDAAFAQRRKTLRAALAGWAGGAPEAERRLRAAGIDPSLRGEALDVTDFARLADVAPAGETGA
jgi:16S rRNA (adenine1518-N6/adenine1519-N6)-dimethyltransferase